MHAGIHTPGCGPGDAPWVWDWRPPSPWVWAWRPPLVWVWRPQHPGVGLETPPPRCGSEDPPPRCGPGGCPQARPLNFPWVWAWRPPRPDSSTFPWVWGWRPPLQARPLNFPSGCGAGDPPSGQTPQPPWCGPGDLQGMLGYYPPPVDRLTRVKT